MKPMLAAQPASTRRAGLSVVYVVVMLVALIAFVSLAVDIGRLRLATTEVQLASDAAARAGAYALPTHNAGTAIDNAINTAFANTVIDADPEEGQTTHPGLTLDDSEDIEFGHWDSSDRTFNPVANAGNTVRDERMSANAVRVVGRRIAARDNPIPLILAPVVGVFSKDVEREAIAYVTGGPANFAFVGIDEVRSNGNKARLEGSVASDGDIVLGNGDVIGDARPGMDANDNISQNPNSNITGWTAKLDYRLSDVYKLQSPPPGSTPVPGGNNPTLIGSNNPNSPRNFYGAIPNRFTLNGYIRIYVTTGTSLNLTPNITYTNPSTRAANRFEVYVATTGITSFSQNGNAQIYAHVYAPTMNFSIGGTADFYGWVIAKRLTFTGNSTYRYDNSKPTTPHYTVRLVK